LAFKSIFYANNRRICRLQNKQGKADVFSSILAWNIMADAVVCSLIFFY